MEAVKKSNPNLAFGKQPGVLQRTQLLLDWSKMDRKGIIQIKPNKLVKHKESSLKFRSFRAKKVFYDPKAYNITCGIPMEQYDNGTYKFMQLSITERTMFNLEDELDAQRWHVFRHLNEVQGSPNLSGEPTWLIHNEDIIAEEGINKTEKTLEAWELIRELSENKINSIGRLFGRNPATESPKIIKNYLLQTAAKDPEKIINAFANAETLELQVVFYRALAVGIIKSTIDRGYITAKGLSLGSTPLACVEVLRKDIQLLQIIDFESKTLDKTYIKDDEDDVVENIVKRKLFKPKAGTAVKNKQNKGIIDKSKIKPATKGAKGEDGPAAPGDDEEDNF